MTVPAWVPQDGAYNRLQAAVSNLMKTTESGVRCFCPICNGGPRDARQEWNGMEKHHPAEVAEFFAAVHEYAEVFRQARDAHAECLRNLTDCGNDCYVGSVA